MALATGDRTPSTELHHMTADGPASISSDDLFKGKKVVLFAVPGAFTPTCSAAHLPGFVVNADAIKSKGVDAIVCLSVNDAFVMDAWGKAQNADAIHMVADASGEFTQAMGLQLDLTAIGLGVRSQRYAMVVDNGVIGAINVDEGGKLERSSAERMLEAL